MTDVSICTHALAALTTDVPEAFVSDVSTFSSVVRFVNAACKLSATYRGLCVLGAAIGLVSCGDQDRVLHARCRVASDDELVASFAPPKAIDASIGGFNGRVYELGTLFRVAPDPKQMGRVRWTAVHTLAGRAATLSHDPYWNSQSLHVGLEMDLDGDELAESSRAIIESTLLSGSGVMAYDVERQTIKNVLQVINDDSGALNLVRGATRDERYLVASSRLLAREVLLLYTPGGGIGLSDGQGSASRPFISMWTFRIGRTNFHSNYSCAPLEQLNAKASSTNSRVPVVYFYTSVLYDPSASKAARDRRSIDLDYIGNVSHRTHSENQEK